MIKTARMMSHSGALKCRKVQSILTLFVFCPMNAPIASGHDDEQDDLDAEAALLGR